MKRLTWKQIETFLKHKLMFDERWAIQALLRIYEFQTLDERMDEDSKWINGVGFNSCDSNFLSSIAKFYKKHGKLTHNQIMFVHRHIPKYWKQVWEISDQVKLQEMIENQTI